jgi:hypothetical protein
MAGWLTNGSPQLNTAYGAETSPWDSNGANGTNPQSGAINMQQLAIYLKFFNNTVDGSPTTSGYRWFSSVTLGSGQTFTGISGLVGATGGTDKWIFELHGPTGTLLATTATAGVTAGTAATWQQIPFTATYTVTTPGVYWLVLQANGNTAKYAALNAPTSLGIYTGTAASGTFGTGASITPTTTYTRGQGPMLMLY